MTRFAHSLLALTLLAVTPLLVACTAEEPGWSKYDGPAKQDLVPWPPDYPSSCPAVPTLKAPVLDSFFSPTAYARYPFRGTATGASDITATGGTGNFTAKVGSSGSFCVEVILIPDAPNTIKFIATDANGCPSLPYTTTITHKTAPALDSGITTPVNLAKLQPIWVKGNKVKSGSESYANDGDATTSVELDFFDLDTGGTCDECTWVKIDLGKVYTISKLRIKWDAAAGPDYAVCYTILLAASASAADPTCSQFSIWKAVVKETAGVQATKDITINPEKARLAALLMYENASASLWETFKLAELEVWGMDPDAVPPKPPDRCK